MQHVSANLDMDDDYVCSDDPNLKLVKVKNHWQRVHTMEIRDCTIG